MSNDIATPPESESNNIAWYSVNQDCCGRCGMSGLEMLQTGQVHQCEPLRAVAYQKNQSWNLWRWQSEEFL